MTVFGPSNLVVDGQEGNGTGWTGDPGNYFPWINIGRNAGNTWGAGFRWTGVNVPQGATINTATITFQTGAGAAGYVIGVYAEDADNAATYNGSTRRPSQLTPTTAKTSVTAGIALNATGQTIAITSILQEIVDRTGWASGNALNVFLLNEAGAAGAYDYFRVVNHERTIGGFVTTLTVDYTAGGSDVSDTLGLSDTIVVKLSASSSLTDTLGLADTIVDKKSAVASLADTLGLSDTILAKVSAITGPADTLGISDSIVSKLSFDSALADTLGIADTIAAIVSGTDVFLTDTLGLSDTISIKLSYSPALSDTLGISDSIDPTNAFFRALVDTLGISDTIKTGVGVGLSDTLGISDSVAVQMSLVSLLVDTLGLADTLDLLNTFNVSLTDTLGLSDVISTLTSPQDLQIICQTCGSGWRKKDTRQMYHFKGQTIINNTSPSAIVALGETMQFCPKCNVRELLDLTKSLDSGPEALRLRTIPEHAEKADSGGADVVHDQTRVTRK